MNPNFQMMNFLARFSRPPNFIFMENSAFIPPHIANPRLVVLGSTAEDAAQSAGRRSSRQTRQKVEEKGVTSYPMHPLYHGPNGLPVFNNAQVFPHPAMRPTVEDGHRLMNPLGPGAFRPFQVSEEQEGFYHHSAFVPAKQRKMENGKIQSVSNSEDWSSVQTCSTENSEKGTESSLRPEMGVKHEIDDSDFSERGETPCSFESAERSQAIESEVTDRSSPEEGRHLRRKRKCSYLLDGQMCCSVCGVTVRAGELQSHLNQEVERLNKMTRSGRRSRDSSGSRKGSQGPSSRRNKDNPSSSDNPETRFETYLKIKSNRQSRLNARVGRSRRGRRSGDYCGDLTHCPICDEVLEGSPEERNHHAEVCLRKQHHISPTREDMAVDVEGEEYEEYTWCGQTRIRATTMLQAGFKGTGFQRRIYTEEDVDMNLNVDGDDTAEYGQPQFTEADIIPCSSDEPSEERQRQAIRGALLTFYDTYNDDDDVDIVDDDDEGYTTPLVSVQCWHVHCQECWLRTLGAKKLCPQCNMITAPAQLRKIYL
ncbi:E3 ubiquitin-protein ligase RNF220-like [Anneissia japonica]|uniref:E3 ubiquitin-protein ligase RNF220-like n=1 Tax=Anneissia japonica TaxID=1529436 RepID=UPI00142580F5|nr:E3 ubiquitin-protein ligase RNF220-like [Anneissia japonica]